MGGQARRSLCRHRLGSGARQICLKIKLISRLGAGPSPRPSFLARSPVVLFLPPSGIALFLSSLGISRTRANRRHGTEGGGGEEGGGPEVLRATDTDPEARREGGAATKSFGLLAAAVAGP